jgi:hypothetical protein
VACVVTGKRPRQTTVQNHRSLLLLLKLAFVDDTSTFFRTTIVCTEQQATLCRQPCGTPRSLLNSAPALPTAAANSLLTTFLRNLSRHIQNTRHSLTNPSPWSPVPPSRVEMLRVALGTVSAAAEEFVLTAMVM